MSKNCLFAFSRREHLLNVMYNILSGN